MTQLLTQNAKMKKSSIKGLKVMDFSIPAYKSITGLITCPSASKCVSSCYARSGAYTWGMVKKAHEFRLNATFQENFVDVMDTLIKAKKKRTKKLAIRIHSSGDFYSSGYLTKWLTIIDRNPDVTFYAYTKMVRQFKELQTRIKLPDNFTVIYSFGGRDDNLINREVDRHSLVFENKKLLTKDYSNASDNDTVAFGANHKIGLVFHSNKKWDNAQWKNVAL